MSTPETKPIDVFVSAEDTGGMEPEGVTMSFPAGTTDLEIDNAIAEAYGGAPPAVEVETSVVDYLAGKGSAWLESMGEDMASADLALTDTMASLSGLEAQEQDTLGLPTTNRPLYSSDNSVLKNAAGSVEGGVQVLGNLALRGGSLVGNTVVTLLGAGVDALPEAVIEYATGAFDDFIKSDLGKQGINMLTNLGKLTDTYVKKYPQEAKSLMGAFEAGTLAIPVSKLGDKTYKAGKKMAEAGRNADRDALAGDLLAPPHKLGPGDTTETGIMQARTRVYEPTPRDLEVATDVAKVPNIKPGRSAAHNNAQVVTEVRSLRATLDQAIRKAGNPDVNTDSLMDDIGQIVDNMDALDASVSLSGKASDFAEKIMWKAMQFIDESDGTAQGILDARRQLDRWVEKNSGSSYDPEIISGRNIATSLIRNRINEEVIDVVPSVPVKNLLRNQSNLLTASEVLQDKIKLEGLNMFSRAIDQVTSGRVGPVGAMSIMGGLPTLGAAMGLPVGTAGLASLTGAGLMAAYITWNSATRKKVLGELIKFTSKQIKTGSNVEQMKLDRLLLIDMLQAEATTEETPDG